MGIFTIQSFSQIQDFEKEFSISSYPDEFLPGWYGNEVRATTSRIFQSLGLGRGGSKALAIQPISTFNGVLWIRLNLEANPSKKVVFWARSQQNGAGNRPALVFYSWGKGLDGEFSGKTQLGSNSEFPNVNQDFRRFILEVPEELGSEEEIILRLEVNYGNGTGSAARWLMDDFAFEEFIPDTIAPEIASVKGYSAQELLIRFSEKVDPVFSLLPPAYELEGENPEKIKSQNDSTFILSFGESLTEGKVYSLKITQIPDLDGNILKDTLVNFKFFDPRLFSQKSIVINELMPAPRADQDLPNVEYVELYNPTEKEYRLDSLILSNTRTSTRLENYWLGPEKYLILVPKGQEKNFTAYGEVLGVANWPTLLNSGDQVIMKTDSGLEIDRISFSTSSWGGSEFAGGGYSLEVPDPYLLCTNSEFLKSSKDPKRGTPGVENSVFDPNFQLPELKITSAYFLDSLSFEINFSGPFSNTLALNQIQISPSLNLESLSIEGKKIKVLLAEKALPNQLFQLSINELQDCRGKSISVLGPIELVLPLKPKKGDILLNELLFNPISGDPKFVEIHNRSENYLSLENWALGNLDNQGQVAQVRVFGNRDLVIPPRGFLAITTDQEKLKIRYPKSQSGKFIDLASLPSFPISGGTVVLISSSGEAEENFTYSEELHHPLLRDSKGVSLERVYSGIPVNDPKNWQSASGNEDFATPGRKNSQALDEQAFEESIRIDPPVFDPEGSSGPSFTSIRYQFEDPGWIGTFRIVSSSGQFIYTLCQNAVLGTEGQFVWNGVDSKGARVKPGYYVLLVEMVDLGGKTLVIKKTIVVATRL
ncbi:lamin tail domain-containing protein [Algoriphagus boseongensis]|nr:lamin tail domain-containing protein [Algoriphagus boseongensis]